VLVALNKSGQAASVRLPVRGLYPNGATLENVFDGTTQQVSGGAVEVTVPPVGGLVLVGR
jgi:hypothetical protein